MKILLGSALIALLLYGDLLLGNAALVLNLCVYGAFYLAGACGRTSGLTAALVSGVVLDAVYHRPFGISAALFVFAGSLGYLAAARTHFRLPETPLVSGCVIGVTLFSGNAAIVRLFNGTFPGPDFLSTLIFQTVFGTVFMLLLTSVLDFIGRCAGLPLFEREILARSARSRRYVSRSALRSSPR